MSALTMITGVISDTQQSLWLDYHSKTIPLFIHVHTKLKILGHVSVYTAVSVCYEPKKKKTVWYGV